MLVTMMMLAGAPAAEPQVDWDTKGKELVTRLAKGELEAATSTFDATMKAALPAAKVSEVWAALQAQAGKFVSITGARNEPVPGTPFRAVLVACKFEKATLSAKVVLDAGGKVAGLFFLPSDLTVGWAPPPYASPERFKERDVKVGTASLPGKLTVPGGKGPFPAVVLVHGSGPNDEDETITFANKPFKDLAVGLSSQGVMVLRYVKRSRAAPASVVTLREEVLDDAAAAVDLVKAQPEADKAKVVVVGHSLGGYLMPWLARERPDVAGVVLLAASARPLLELLVEQRAWFHKLQPSEASAKALEEAKQMKVRVDAKDLKPDEEIFHAKGAYWLALRDYRPVDTAAKLKTPMLVLQGERDYQVSPSNDYGMFRKGLAGPRVTFKSYPALNHLFMAGEGPSTPAEYERPSHVDPSVVTDIADWVKKR